MGVSRPAGPFLAAIVVGASAAGFAPGGAPPTSTTASAPASSTASPAPRRPRIHSFVGEVVEIQADKLVVRETLRDGSPKTTTFSTTAKTAVIRGADPATLADVHANDHVTIKYREDPAKNKEAVSIRITPSAAPKPSK